MSSLGSQKFWSLSTGQIRCSKCGLIRKASQNIWKKRRISPYWKGRLIEYFCLGIPHLSPKISGTSQPVDHPEMF